ncbi:hypothetical protein DRH29_02000 [candidate division Kazan bacterium]|uniref:BIG2 domain-containing protein n=1 Tax=candidate division Kazan bacterium TaxID=2202143 RepID=A0A420ZD67_UNCK3|nr:MAG: hypothetical protein DRH29_02000 [candidate division Kazan bacterium]
MKNKNLLHKIIRFAEAELGLSLAVLILGAVMIGGTTAYVSPAPLSTGNVENSITTYPGAPTNSQLIIDQIEVDGLNFTATDDKNLYRVTTGWQGDNQDLITTRQGTRGASDNKTYIYRIDLSRPYSGMVWLAGRYESAEVNGISVTPSQALVNLNKASEITLKFKGGDKNTFAALTEVKDRSYPGVMLASVSATDLVVIPDETEVAVGGQIQLRAVEVDKLGRALVSNPIWQVEESSKNIIRISNKGLVTGLAPGRGYAIAKTNKSTAYCEISVKHAPTTIMAVLLQSQFLQPINLFSTLFEEIVK